MALATTVFVFAAPVIVCVVTLPPSVMVWYFVLVETGSVVLMVDVTSLDLVRYEVCCSPRTVEVFETVLKLVIVTAGSVAVDKEVGV